MASIGNIYTILAIIALQFRRGSRGSFFRPIAGKCSECQNEHEVKRAKFLLLLLLGSVFYWMTWFGFAGVILMIHGDCGAGTTDTELARCVTEKTWIFRGLVVLAAALYLATVVGVVRKYWPAR